MVTLQQEVEPVGTKDQMDLPGLLEIERVSGLSYREFEEQFLNPPTPVVLTDAAKDWPAIDKWTPEFFKNTFGERTFEIDGKTHVLSEFIDLVLASDASNPAPYLKNILVPVELPELEPDMEPSIPYNRNNRLGHRLMMGGGKKWGETELFIGGDGGFFPNLHTDTPPMHTWSTLLYGEKEFTLYAPDQTEFLYPDPAVPDKSLIPNIFDPDVERFPLFKNARGYVVIQKPGETLMVPCGWWHTARMSRPSITVASDQLHATNWWPYFWYTCRRRALNKSPKYLFGIVSFFYLLAAGAVMSIQERLMR